MRKKFAILMIFIFMSLSVLTGCNLFSKNNYASLSSIVATSGDISITREELINAYNSSGYYYYYAYGYTQEGAVKQTINDLIDQQFLLNYLKNSTDSKLMLNEKDFNNIISQTWDYVNESILTYVNEVRKELKLPLIETEESETEEEEPEFAPQEQYKTKFELINDKVYLIQEDEESVTVDSKATSLETAFNYALENYPTLFTNFIKSNDQNYKNLIWKRYLAALKTSQSNYGYKDMSDDEVFKRELQRIFDAVVDSVRVTKFQSTVVYGCEYDEQLNRYYLTDVTLQSMVNKYVELYEKNYEDYQNNSQDFYKSIANSSNAKDYVFYGDSSKETFITVSHILVKLSDEQIAQIESIENDTNFSPEAKEKKIYEIKKQTLVYERDLETGEVIDEVGITIGEMYENLLSDLKNVYDLSERTKIFNNYLYRYNVDTGIINATNDYVVGTKNSAMVSSFTDAARQLYNNGKVGDVSGLEYEDNDDYTGYHIVFYTGTLQNIFSNKDSLSTLTIDNIYNLLSKKYTSLSYNQTLFEFIFDKINDTNYYNTYSDNLVKTLKNNVEIKYNVDNFSDLY